jgi:hypothetical protein
MLSGPKEYHDRYFAEDTFKGIDEYIARESSGFLAFGEEQPDISRQAFMEKWEKHWVRVYAAIERSVHYSDTYDGPKAADFLLYIIENRRKEGLPEIASLMELPKN